MMEVGEAKIQEVKAHSVLPASEAAGTEMPTTRKPSWVAIWWRQFTTLLWKNMLVLRRRRLMTAVALLSQILAPLMFLQDPGVDEQLVINPNDFAPVSLVFDPPAQACAVEFPEACVRLAYAPTAGDSGDLVSATIAQLRSDTGLSTSDVRGFETYEGAQQFVADNLGKVEHAVFFAPREACRGTDFECLAYELWYNGSDTSALQSQSEDIEVSLPTLRLQTALDAALLQTVATRNASQYSVAPASLDYDLSYGRFTPFQTTDTLANNATTPCDLDVPTSEFSRFVTNLAPIILIYILPALLFFQLLIEEREEKLILGLRRIGLRDSAYHAAWLVWFTCLSLVGNAFGAIVFSALGKHTTSSVDASVFFFMTFFYSIALFGNMDFLASLCVLGGDFPVFLVLLTLLTMVLTATVPSSFLRTYTTFQAGFSDAAECLLRANSFDDVYGTTLTGFDVAEFVVFWMPWYHFLRFLTAICSNAIVPDPDTYTWSDFGSTVDLLSGGTKIEEFPANSNDLHLLIWNLVIYMFLGWFLGQVLSSDVGEGRSLSTFLGPLRAFFAQEKYVPLEGDIRGREKARSLAEKSIVCYKVSKVFKGTTALKEVSLTIPENQVFALLGHNGAGKTTLINCLTGALNPTHGKAYVQGFDVQAENDDVQAIIGVCPQHDHLYPDLTAREHMYLYARFKGVKITQSVGTEIQDLLEKVGLDSVENRLARSFSGGMKRRLSLAMSAVGDSKILFLDEPTTGLDPLSKRRVWDTITYLKQNRIVLLTTHSMEEADSLGDQICIFHSGQVRALGDSLFLKKRYGSGYQISVVLSSGDTSEAREQITGLAPTVEFVDTNEIRGEQTGYLTLSLAERNALFLPRLFQWLQANTGGGVKEWGLSNATLEQVFLRLSAQNQGVNITSNRDGSNACILCGKPTDRCIVRTHDTRVSFLLGDVICNDCAKSPPFLSREAAWAMMGFATLEDVPEEEKIGLTGREEVTIPLLEGTENAEGEEGKANELRQLLPVAQPLAAGAFDPSKRRSTSNPFNQARAKFFNEMRIQSKKPITIGCLACCKAIALGAFYVLAILVPIGFNINVCDEGYVLDDCDSVSLISEVFSRSSYLLQSSSNVSWDPIVDTTCTGAWWSREDDSSIFWSTEDLASPWRDFASAQGLSEEQARDCLSFSTTAAPLNCTDFLRMWPSHDCNMAIPQAVAYTFYETPPGSEDYDAVLFAQQEEIFERLLVNVTEATCPIWIPDGGLPEAGEVSEAYQDILANAGMSCSGGACDLAAWKVDATLYTTAVDGSGGGQYPYLFGNFLDDTNGDCSAVVDGTPVTVSTREFGIPQTPSDLLEALGTGSIFSGGDPDDSLNQIVSHTNAAAKYISTVTNSLAFSANAGRVAPAEVTNVHSYATLEYITEETLRLSLANLLLLCFFLGINLYFPLAVWRIGYQINLGTPRFLEAIDIRRLPTAAGSIFFDFSVFFATRVVVTGIARVARLSIFRSINFGYLLAWSLTSSIGLTGFAHLLCMPIWVFKFKNSHRVFASLAGMLVILFVILNFILNNPEQAFEDEDSFPLALHLIPFASEYRALLWLLVREEPTRDFAASSGFLIAVGVGGILIALFSDDLSMQRFQAFYAASFAYCTGGHRTVGAQAGSYKNLHVAGTDVEEGRNQFDEDLQEMSLKTQEAVQRPGEQAVVIHKLEVTYPGNAHQGPFTAVRNLDLTIPYGETFALLGPNGAGKTTTIHVMTGMLQKSSGTVVVGGINIEEDPSAAGSQLGIVPQFEVVWPELTVEEHLDFFCLAKGFYDLKERRAEVQRVAVSVRLDGDAFLTRAGQLSGGMRRRLAIGIAIIGSPPLIILDEPTTGLDPENRQIIWSIISGLRDVRRTVLVTTHSMVEAEALSTSIGIMVHGKLRCVGTSLHLKAKYGSGFSLFINVPTPVREDVEDDVDVLVRKDICDGSPGGELVSVRNTTRRYQLPTEIDVAATFETMSRRSGKLGVQEWGLSMSTMEDVFVSVVEAAE